MGHLRYDGDSHPGLRTTAVARPVPVANFVCKSWRLANEVDVAFGCDNAGQPGSFAVLLLHE